MSHLTFDLDPTEPISEPRDISTSLLERKRQCGCFECRAGGGCAVVRRDYKAVSLQFWTWILSTMLIYLISFPTH